MRSEKQPLDLKTRRSLIALVRVILAESTELDYSGDRDHRRL